MMENKQLQVANVADYFQFLASCFLKNPGTRWLKGAKDAVGKLLQTGICSGELVAVLESLQRRQTLTQAYYDLLFVPQSGSYVPPFESAIANGYYRDDGSYYFGNLAGEQEADVAKYYSQFGFHWRDLDIYKPLKLIPFADHIGFELAFSGFLAYYEEISGESENALRYRKWRHEFLASHLGRWVGDYADLVVRSNETPFYRNLVVLTKTFIDMELAGQEPLQGVIQ